MTDRLVQNVSLSEHTSSSTYLDLKKTQQKPTLCICPVLFERRNKKQAQILAKKDQLTQELYRPKQTRQCRTFPYKHSINLLATHLLLYNFCLGNLEDTEASEIHG